MGLQSPKIDKMAMASHKQPTNRITSVGWYAFSKTVAAAFFEKKTDDIEIQPATMMFAMYIIFSAIMSLIVLKCFANSCFYYG